MGNFIQTYETTAEYNTAEPNLVLPNVSLTNDDMEVHYNKWVDPYNGHAYVDLGLPSGTLWATMNVGANSETDYGLYFAWGDTKGHADASTKAFSWSDYKFNPSGDGSTMTKYNKTDLKTVLDLEDDAVAVAWGGDWHMPTETQLKELLDPANCTSTWTTVDGVNGRLFTSKTNGNTLFIPAAGYAYDGSVSVVGSGDYVWSSSLDDRAVDIVKYSHCLQFGRNDVLMLDSPRCYGLSVRGVI